MKKIQKAGKVLFLSTLGNLVEWYDYLIYAYLAPFLITVFFPMQPVVQSLIKLMLIFAFSYLARIIGSLLFGPMADRFGRKKALVGSTLLMGIATMAMGFTPNQSSFESNTPFYILLCLRILQGISVGGEYMITAIYITEYAPSTRRGLFGSFINTSGSLGVISASFIITLLFSVFSSSEMTTFGWRLPFFLGFISMLVALFIRLRLKESPIFESMRISHKTQSQPLLQACKNYKKPMSIVFILVSFQAITFYITSLFFGIWANAFQDISLSWISFSLIIASILTIASGMLGGFLSDKMGRRPILLIGVLGIVLFSWPVLWFITQSKTPDQMALNYLLGQSLLYLFLGLYNGVLPATIVELFPSTIRCSSILFSFNTSTALFGGTAPLLCLWILKSTTFTFFPAIYMIIIGLLASFCIIFLLKESYKTPLTKLKI